MPKKKKRSKDAAYDANLLAQLKALEEKEPAQKPGPSRMQHLWRAKELREKREEEAALNPKIPKKKSKFPKRMIAPSADDVHRMAQAVSTIQAVFESILGEQESGMAYGALADDAPEEYQDDLGQLTGLLDSHTLSRSDKDAIRSILSYLAPPSRKGYGDAFFALSPSTIEGVSHFKLKQLAKTVGIYKPEQLSPDELSEVLLACVNPTLRSLLLLRQFAEYYLQRTPGSDSEDDDEHPERETSMSDISAIEIEIRDLESRLGSASAGDREGLTERLTVARKQLVGLKSAYRNSQSSQSLERVWETFQTLPNVAKALRFRLQVEKHEGDEDTAAERMKARIKRSDAATRAQMYELFGSDDSDDSDDEPLSRRLGRPAEESESDSDSEFGEDSMMPPETSGPLPDVDPLAGSVEVCDGTSLDAELTRVQQAIKSNAEALASAEDGSDAKLEHRTRHAELIIRRREIISRIRDCSHADTPLFGTGEEVRYLPMDELATITGVNRSGGCVAPYILRLDTGDEIRAWSSQLRPQDGAEVSTRGAKKRTVKWWDPTAEDDDHTEGEDSTPEDGHLPNLKFYDETQGTVMEVAPRTSAFYDEDNVPMDCISMYKNPPWLKQVSKAMYVRFTDPTSFNSSEFVNPSPINLVETGLKNNVRIPAKIVGLEQHASLNGLDATLIGLEGDNAYKVEVTQNRVKRVIRLAKTNVVVPDIYRGNWYRPTKLYYALQCYRLKDKKQEGNVFSGSIDLEPTGEDADSADTARLSMEICYRTASQFIFQDEDMWSAETREHDRRRQSSVTKLEKLMEQPINEGSIAFTVAALSRSLDHATATNLYSVSSDGDPLKLKEGDHERTYVRIAVDCMVAACRQGTNTIKSLFSKLARIVAFINLDKKDSEHLFISRLRQERYAPEVLCTLSDEEMAPRVFLGPSSDPSTIDIFNRNLGEELSTLETHYAIRFYRTVHPNDQMIREREGSMWTTTPHLVSLAPWIDQQCELKSAGEDPSKIVYYKPSDGSGPECFKIDDIIQNKISGDTRPPEFTEFLDNIKRIYGPFEKFRLMRPRSDKPVYQGNQVQKNAVLALFQKVGLESWRANDLPPVPQLLTEYERNFEGMWNMLSSKYGSELAIPPKIPSAIIAPGLFDKMRERLSACIARGQETTIPEPHGHENWIEAQRKWDHDSRKRRPPATQDDTEDDEARQATIESDIDSEGEEPMMIHSDHTESSRDDHAAKTPTAAQSDTKSPRLNCEKCGGNCAHKRITFPYLQGNSVSMLHFCGRECAERAPQFE